MSAKRICTTASVLLGLCAGILAPAPAAAAQQFQSDEWITECDGEPSRGVPDCSLTVPFWQARGAQNGSFALVVMLQTGNIGIVGQPFPVKAVLRVDKNPPIECRQMRYCVFPSGPALAIVKQLKAGTLILIDVYTDKGAFNFSLTPKGYQAGIAKIRAWGYRLLTE
jgi:invasion protein IalB